MTLYTELYCTLTVVMYCTVSFTSRIKSKDAHLKKCGPQNYI